MKNHELNKLIIKRAEKKDIPLLCNYRYSMFEDMGTFSDLSEKRDELMQLTKEYFERVIDSESHYSIIVSLEDNEIGCGTLLISERPPHPRSLKNHIGYILNVYIEEAHRKKGYATVIMKHFEEYARQKNIYRLELNASEKGRPVYDKLGYSVGKTFMESYI